MVGKAILAIWSEQHKVVSYNELLKADTDTVFNIFYIYVILVPL